MDPQPYSKSENTRGWIITGFVIVIVVIIIGAMIKGSQTNQQSGTKSIEKVDRVMGIQQKKAADELGDK
jgi:hypothetical protein